NGVAQDHRQALLQDPLHRAKLTFLASPPVEIGAIVGDVEAQANQVSRSSHRLGFYLHRKRAVHQPRGLDTRPFKAAQSWRIFTSLARLRSPLLGFPQRWLLLRRSLQRLLLQPAWKLLRELRGLLQRARSLPGPEKSGTLERCRRSGCPA